MTICVDSCGEFHKEPRLGAQEHPSPPNEVIESTMHTCFSLVLLVATHPIHVDLTSSCRVLSNEVLEGGGSIVWPCPRQVQGKATWWARL